MLYTSKEIAEMYGGKENNVTQYTVTQTWIPAGLKHIRGKGNGYLFKTEWVDDFLEKYATVKESKNTTFKFAKQSKKNTKTICLVH